MHSPLSNTSKPQPLPHGCQHPSLASPPPHPPPPPKKPLALLMFIFQPAWPSLRGTSRFGESKNNSIRRGGRDCLAGKASKRKKGETLAPQCFSTSWLVSRCLFQAPVLGSPSSELVRVLCGDETLEVNSSNSDAGCVRTVAPGRPAHHPKQRGEPESFPGRGQLHPASQQGS